MNIYVINGPNLNLLGIREPSVYGNKTYRDLSCYLKALARKYGIKIKIIQTNSETKIIDTIHKAYFKKVDGIVLNPAAYTHYSYAIHDAIKSVDLKVVEVHLSDINNRDDFRKNSVVKDVCVASFSGMHFESYKQAIEFLIGV